VLSGEATNTNFKVFGLTRLGLEPTIYRTRGEHTNHYATDVVCASASVKQQSAEKRVAPLDRLFWFRVNQSLIWLVKSTCLADEQQIPIWYYLVGPNRSFNPWSTTLEASTLTIVTSPMLLILPYIFHSDCNLLKIRSMSVLAIYQQLNKIEIIIRYNQIGSNWKINEGLTDNCHYTDNISVGP
jgi:hypothetical protein